MVGVIVLGVNASSSLEEKMMSKFTPVTPIFASLDSSEEHKYSFTIQVYRWEKNSWFFGGGYSLSVHPEMSLNGHLTSKRFILESPKKRHMQEWVFWTGRIVSELMKAGLLGRFIEVGQDQEAALKKFVQESGFISLPYSDISKIERVQRMSTSAISLEQFFNSPPSNYVSVVLKKIEQEYYERITFIPYDINMGFMSSPVTDDFLNIINSSIGG